jgi:hypothetical protein
MWRSESEMLYMVQANNRGLQAEEERRRQLADAYAALAGRIRGRLVTIQPARSLAKLVARLIARLTARLIARLTARRADQRLRHKPAIV